MLCSTHIYHTILYSNSKDICNCDLMGMCVWVTWVVEKAGVQMRRQVGSVHLMGVEGAVRGQRLTSGYRRLGWDAVSLGWGQRALSLVGHRLSCSYASY